MERQKTDKTPSVNSHPGDVTDVSDVINKYGTYNIQPTADTANLFPEIAHGLPKKHKKK